MKKTKFLLIILILLGTLSLNAQNITITDDDSHVADPSAMLDVYSLSKGLLIPRMTSSQMNNISEPAEGLIIYNTQLTSFYTYNSTNWTPLSNLSGSVWQSNNDAVYLNDLNMKVGIGTNSPTSKLEVVGDASFPQEDALFEVKNNVGETVFAVYNEGVRVYVSEGTEKGVPGGFAIGGLASGKNGEEYFRITRDSARIWLNTDDTKGVPGGFAIGGLASGKGAEEFLHLDTANYLIGHNTGYSLENGLYNIFIGYESGYNTTGGVYIPGGQQGSNNVFLGYQSGYENTLGFNNVFIGDSCGLSNTEGMFNTYVGTHAGGYSDGTFSTGSYNTFMGCKSGVYNTGGQHNSFYGNVSGWQNTTGTGNTFMGSVSGFHNSTGDYNTCIGVRAGGSNNVFVGTYAGANETGSNLLYIDNSNTIYPLIFGDFSDNEIIINGNSGDNTNNMKFYVYGQAGGTTAWWNDSDKKLKTNIETIPNALDKVMQLRGVNYEWKERRDNTEGTQMGFIAQETEMVIPEVVNNTKGNYAMQYAPITALLVESTKEQQTQIEILKNEIELLKLEIENIKNQINN